MFSLQEIEPNYENHAPRNVGGHWAPPIRRSGIKARGHPHRFRWRSGTPEALTAAQFTNLTQGRTPFDVATMFATNGKFRAVPFNASTTSVQSHNLGDYKEVEFQYVRLGPSAQPLQLYSQVEFAGAHARLAASGQSHWIRDLFPEAYHWRAQDASFANATNAGLIGRLSMILALAAFSCPVQSVGYVISNCLRHKEWRHHNSPHGRTRAAHGRIVIGDGRADMDQGMNLEASL